MAITVVNMWQLEIHSSHVEWGNMGKIWEDIWNKEKIKNINRHKSNK